MYQMKALGALRVLGVFGEIYCGMLAARTGIFSGNRNAIG
jgi:hypothetical protein